MAETGAENVYAERARQMVRIREWHREERAAKAVKALTSHGFEALFVQDREAAKQEILRRAAPGARVGIGGSMTIRELGVVEELERRGNVLYDHWKPGLTPAEVLEIRRAHLSCDVFLTSTNALTLSGELISTDGIGNRVAAMTFGPRRVIVAAGVNKLVDDVASGVQRIKSIATPQTARGTQLDVPCAKTGVCADCNSPQRACRATVILERRPLLTEMLVLVIGEDLGF